MDGKEVSVQDWRGLGFGVTGGEGEDWEVCVLAEDDETV